MAQLKYFMALIGGVVGYLFGDIDGLFIALIVFVITDYLSGVIAAIAEKKLSSEIGFKGILKKVCIFILVTVANIIDHEILKAGSPCRTSVIFFYISNEGISILENVIRLGLPIPEKLKEILDQIKES